MSERFSWNRRLPIVFGLIVLCFVTATGLTHQRLMAIDRASLDIAENAAPSIERLTIARSQLRRLQVLLREYVDQTAAGAPADPEAIEEARHSIGGAITQYLTLPVFPGERALWGGIVTGRTAFNSAVDRCLHEASGGNPKAAEATSRGDVASAADDLSAAITRDIEFNARHSHDLALQIRRRRSRSMYLAYVLDALCALITVWGAFALQRAVRAHTELAVSHQQLLEVRASELELFAASIAHDVVSPLNVVSLAMELAVHSHDDEARARYAARGSAALQRVKQLVDGLLEFARAGAKPEPNTRTAIEPTLAELVNDLKSAAAQAEVTLVFRTENLSPVNCNAGVLTSLVANLARNALKYIGQGPIRRVEIRAFARGDAVRFEVEDTGPGLPPGLEDRVFDPYVRAPGTNQAGIGLGLATVKRLAEGHGGKVGVRSIPGQGCTFWFELPSARTEALAPVTAAHVDPSACPALAVADQRTNVESMRAKL